MRGVFVRRVMIWSQRLNHQSLLSQRKPFCDNAKKPTTPSNEIATTPSNQIATRPSNEIATTPSNQIAKAEPEPEFDPYKEVYTLDWEKNEWEKAMKIMMSERQRKQKFGLDFHLVQLFFACLPSLACYLVALYARKEMKKYQEKFDMKKKAEEEAEAKAKESEINAAVSANPLLVEVKERLDKLEETIRDTLVESKNQSINLEDKSKLEKSKQEPTPTEPNSSPDNKTSSSTPTTKTNSNAEGDASKRDP